MANDKVRPYGVPKTDEERRKEHKKRYGTSNLPPRGYGNPGSSNPVSNVENEVDLVSTQLKDAMGYAANLETIRINRWKLVEGFSQKVGSLNTTTQNLDSEPFKTGWIYVVNNITAIEEGTKPTTIRLGFVRTGHFHRLTIQTPANNNDSVDYTGQLILREGDIIRAQYKVATTGDTIYLYWNGYKIRR